MADVLLVLGSFVCGVMLGERNWIGVAVSGVIVTLAEITKVLT